MTQAARQSARRRRLLTGAASAAAHAGVIALLLFAHADAPKPAEVEPIPVALVAPMRPPEPPKPPTETPRPPEPKTPPPPKLHAREVKRPPPPDVAPLPAAKGPVAQGTAEVSDAELASATTAESGGGGGRSCNMTRWLQTQLRKDPLVRSALADAHTGKPLLVWNGDWIRHGEQEGAGLAAVREGVMWEVGFAPVACRAEPVRGLVLVSLGDGPGSARLVLGAGAWRWSDLLASPHGSVQR